MMMDARNLARNPGMMMMMMMMMVVVVVVVGRQGLEELERRAAGSATMTARDRTRPLPRPFC